MADRYQLTRKKLYELVWEKPITHLAKEFDTPAYELHKICKEFKIPKPLPGHWSKLAHGKEVDRRLLTRNEDLDYKPIIIISYGFAEVKPKKENKKKRETIFIKSPIPITITLHADRLHPIVAKTLKTGFEKERYMDTYGLQKPKETCLRIEVYPETIRRSLLLADTIIKALEGRGHKFKIVVVRKYWHSDEMCEVKDCYFDIKGEKVRFAIYEKKNRIEREYTKEEKAKLDSGGYVSDRYQYLSSGILKVKIPEARYYENTYMDNNIMTVEEQIPIIVKAILTVADMQKKSRIWEKEDEIRRAEEEKIAEHKRLLKKQEQQRINDLNAQVKKWKKAVSIRNYLNAFEEAMGTDEYRDHGMKYWLDWAYGYANQVDPLTFPRL